MQTELILLTLLMPTTLAFVYHEAQVVISAHINTPELVAPELETLNNSRLPAILRRRR